MVNGASRAGDVNQALIELGSTVCKPRDPDCNKCPLRQWCRAYQISEKNVIMISLREPPSWCSLSSKVEIEDIEDACTLCDPIPVLEGCEVPPVTSYPMKTERKKQREELNIVSVVEWRDDSERWFLLTRRPEGGTLLYSTAIPAPSRLISSPHSRSPCRSPRISHLSRSACLNIYLGGKRDRSDVAILPYPATHPRYKPES